MPRNPKKKLGTRKYKDYTDETLKIAVEEVKKGSSLRKVAEKFGISRFALTAAMKGERQPFKETGDSSRTTLQFENAEPRSASIHHDGVSQDIGDLLNIFKSGSTVLNNHEGDFSSATTLIQDVNQCVSINPVSEDIGNILNTNQSCITTVLHHEGAACSSQGELPKNNDNSYYHLLQNGFENTPEKLVSDCELSSLDEYVSGTEVSCSSAEEESTVTCQVRNKIRRRLTDKKIL